MDRRSFVKLAATSGIAVMAPTAFSRPAYAAGRRYEGPYFILIHAGGGWDPTYLCDPKGSDGPTSINRAFKIAEIAPVGPFKTPPSTIDYGAAGMKPFDFFTKYKSQALVINGIDTTTGNHDTGTRYTWSGRSEVGNPAIGALLAAMAGGISDGQAKGPPLAFLSAGGYDNPGGLVPLSRASSSSSMRKLMFPGATAVRKEGCAGLASDQPSSARAMREATWGLLRSSATTCSAQKA